MDRETCKTQYVKTMRQKLEKALSEKLLKSVNAGRRSRAKVIKSEAFQKRLSEMLSEDARYRAFTDGSWEENPELLKAFEAFLHTETQREEAEEDRRLKTEKVRALDLPARFSEHRKKIQESAIAYADRYFKNHVIMLSAYSYGDFTLEDLPYRFRRLDIRDHIVRSYIDISLRFDRHDGIGWDYFAALFERGAYHSLSDFVVQWLSVHDNAVKALIKEERGEKGLKKDNRRGYRRILSEEMAKTLDVYRFASELSAHYTKETFFALLSENPRYADFLSGEEAREKLEEVLSSSFRDRTPDNYADLFPEARMMHRHFVLHVGPTNSGKTYDAMEALKKAGSGIYLAPLRLLAFEQFEKLSNAGCPCNLITGEERILQDGAAFQSSTVEMASTEIHYPCAVIDEAQMLADRERGGAWTQAILGLLSEEIHLCFSPDAEKIIVRLIRSCGDTYEIKRHERMTPLKIDRHDFEFPKGVEKGDALIVFSRKSVHAVVAELKRNKVDCSLIYGSLPYEVRHNEAEKFARGETKVVVATDAIGMGMNLPIRRIIFLEHDKFDGQERRPLKDAEILQIAGRAGRYGLYETGLVNAEYELDVLRDALKAELPPIENAVLSFSSSLLSIEAPLSELYRRWDDLPAVPGFTKQTVTQEIMLCKELEKITDDKGLIYELTRIPFDADENYEEWRELAECVVYGRKMHLNDRLMSRKMIEEEKDLLFLERMHRTFDLYFAFDEKFDGGRFGDLIMQVKSNLSERIMQLLAEKAYKERRCVRCGRKLQWDYPMNLCERCRRVRDHFKR